MNPQIVRMKALLIQNQLRRINLSCVYSIAHREYLFTKTEFLSCGHFMFCHPFSTSLPPSLRIPLNVKLPENCIERVCYFQDRRVDTFLLNYTSPHPRCPNLNIRYKNLNSKSASILLCKGSLIEEVSPNPVLCHYCVHFPFVFVIFLSPSTEFVSQSDTPCTILHSSCINSWHNSPQTLEPVRLDI